MARIGNFEPGTQVVKVHPTEVDCFFQRLVVPDGHVLLHLSTFGSDERASSPKSSQSLQLDRRAASALLGILEDTFLGLRSDVEARSDV